MLTRAGQLEAELGGERHDEDQLAFLRDERDFRNCTLVELPRGDFAVTMLRNCAVAVFLELLWERLAESSDAELAAIAGKAVKEARYHREHAADWVVRLGDGTPESTARMKAALDLLWPYIAELFEADAIDEAAAASGLGPRWADLREHWRPSDARRARRSRPRAAGGARVPQHRQERPAQRAPRLRPGRDAAPAARVSGRRVVIDADAAPALAPARRSAGRRSRVERAWAVLDSVLDPEVPVVSVVDLGIVRAVVDEGDALAVVVTPTYSGCPATEVIEQSIVDALDGAGLGPTRVRMQRAPAWTTDWISDEGRRKLRDYGIAPPGPVDLARGAPIRFSRAAAARARLPALREHEHRAARRLRRHRLQGALALPRLRRALRALQADMKAGAVPALHFHPLRVKSVRPETDEAVVVSFDVPAELAEQFRFTHGQHLTLARDDRRQRRAALVLDLRRHATTASCASACARCRAGAFSTWINESLRAGDTIQVMTPEGRFFVPLDPAQSRHYLGIAGGSGITPILSIMKTVLARRAEVALHADLRQPAPALDDVHSRSSRT